MGAVTAAIRVLLLGSPERDVGESVRGRDQTHETGGTPLGVPPVDHLAERDGCGSYFLLAVSIAVQAPATRAVMSPPAEPSSGMALVHASPKAPQ